MERLDCRRPLLSVLSSLDARSLLLDQQSTTRCLSTLHFAIQCIASSAIFLERPILYAAKRICIQEHHRRCTNVIFSFSVA